MTTPRADDWRSRGGYFSWRPAQGDASWVEIFHVEMGDPGAPVLLLIHGWPTSSIDWFEVAGPLSGRFRVCALDFPGYGFSDKPEGQVIAQTPTGGDEVNKDSEVVLTISKGPNLIDVPQVVGLTEAEATGRIQAAGTERMVIELAKKSRKVQWQAERAKYTNASSPAREKK